MNASRFSMISLFYEPVRSALAAVLRRSGNNSPLPSKLGIARGPEPTLVVLPIVAVQILESCRSSMEEHSRRGKACIADHVDVDIFHVP